DTPAGCQKVDLNRGELELTLARGLRRALEVLLPGPALTSPAESNLQVAHGSRRWVDGQRLVTLHGTPEQIGKAHGELLREESLRCVDSVLYAFGTVQTIVNGRWFRHDLESAYERLARHIPDDHRRETRALAASLNIPAQVAEVVNVFPEMFHCSGFAVFGKATKDGKMYHGRVLDYMTTIGLQDAATTMVIAVDGKIPFVTVGYGGFIGSVSGMNIQAISLGEMGGRGEGKWDGVPMATLMRRALEECTTLDQVMDLWKKSPRTCEYYYVFADGKTKRAVGVAAVPEQIEFLQPGQSDPRLGDGIPDTVVLSAGDRLQKLRERVQKKYGEIDVEAAQWLMSRPVAMTSNLHNVLFVPEDRVLYVANADHRHPAAERPYVKFDLRKLIQEMPAKVQ
ncbi:MAG: C45 family autoproteolytic acyltransferase/hydrolase, partial [Planctomycetota bacterium]